MKSGQILIKKTLPIILIFSIITLCIPVICLSIHPEAEAIGILPRTIVIDAGHGGIDAGTIGVVTKNKESDLNLQISYRLSDLLEGAGLSAVMTRRNKDGLYGQHSPGFKRRDMLRRAEIIKSAAPSIVISIHMNKFSSPSRRGAQVYYQKGNAASQELAKVIQNVVNAEINLVEGGRNFSALSGDFYVCKVSNCPAVIVECGFLSNPEDDKLLATAEYQIRIANAIKNGICEYLAMMTIAP